MDIVYTAVAVAFVIAILAPGEGLFPVGATQVNWAYVLSGGIALALLIYLVGALIRAEDL